MHITLRQLHGFEAVARGGSISRAATKLQLEQPGVSCAWVRAARHAEAPADRNTHLLRAAAGADPAALPGQCGPCPQ
jgi:hypothetical protein